MPPKDFAAFILTHGRPDNVETYGVLRKSGYTGRIYLIVDDEDKALPKYKERYGDEVVVFDKKKVALKTDRGDNKKSLATVLFARNASFEIARKLKLAHFIQLDDDYTGFQYRFDADYDYAPKTLKNLDRVFGALLKFHKASGAVSTTIAQGGDFIGGEDAAIASGVRLKRKAMNSFICTTMRPFPFVARMNDDVSTYVVLGSRGRLFFTVNQVNLNQLQTQSNPGGLTEMYLESGTYVKSFYSVMYHPSSVKVGVLRDRAGTRLHHRVDWKATTPMILRESVKKKAVLRKRQPNV